MRNPAPLLSRAHDTSPRRRARAGRLVPSGACTVSDKRNGRGFPVTDCKRLAHIRIKEQCEQEREFLQRDTIIGPQMKSAECVPFKETR